MIGETVTVHRAGAQTGEDEQGNPIFETVTIEVPGCAFAPSGMTEDVATFGTSAITGGTIYAPSGTVFLPSDLVVIRGMNFTIDGETGQWTSPFDGIGAGAVVAMKRSA